MKRFFKYALVGGSGIIVNEFFLYFFTELVGLFFVLSGIIAVELAIISNFLLNDFWTFNDRRSKSKFFRGVKFNAVSLVGLAINVSALYFFTTVLIIYYLASNLIGIIIAFLWNYAVNFYWTWRK